MVFWIILWELNVWEKNYVVDEIGKYISEFMNDVDFVMIFFFLNYIEIFFCNYCYLLILYFKLMLKLLNILV